MPSYTLYHMNLVTGHIDGKQRIHAGDDAAAVHLVQQRAGEGPLELWRDGRKICRMDGSPNVFQAHMTKVASGGHRV